MKIPIYQFDAFTDRLFRGNPAAVCPLEDWPDDATLQAVAAENNLSETAFFVEVGDDFHLRWFTPTTEVDLCGHATLATAHLLMNELDIVGDVVGFKTRSGRLIVRRDGDLLTLDFPAMAPAPCADMSAVTAALGYAPQELLKNTKLLAVLETEAQVRALEPDFARIAQLPAAGLIATAPGDDVDFVSRYFTPRNGIDEDPVTGAAHCVAVPYWAERLGKTRLTAEQVSARGGALLCGYGDGRVLLSGRAVKYMEGVIDI